MQDELEKTNYRIKVKKGLVFIECLLHKMLLYS